MLAPAPAEAVVMLQCSAFADIDPAGPSDPPADVHVTQSDCSAGAFGDVVDLTTGGGADLGVLRSETSVTFQEGPLDGVSGSTSASFRDTIQVDVAGLAGELVLIQASVRLTGIIDVAGSAFGSVGLNQVHPLGLSQLFLAQCFGGSPVCIPAGGGTLPIAFDRIVDASFVARAGQPGLFGLILGTSVGRNPISTDAGAADFLFGSTLTWQGISGVTHQGNPVDFTITSESGTDWTQPSSVPEPALAALLALGAGAAIRRRR
jgi:MYXO-CTERM domain-containing protein